MKKNIKFIIAFALLIPFFTSQAQEFVGGYSLGYASYKMDDMKNLQEIELKEVQPILTNLKTTDDFPDGLFQNAYLGIKKGVNEFGIRYDFLTTGGKNQVKDYSGEYCSDVVIKGNAIGIYYKFHFLSIPINQNITFSGNAGLAVGLVFNDLKVNHLRTLTTPPYGYANDSIDAKASSTNWYIQPTVGFQFWFKKHVCLNFNAGYEFDVQGKIKTPYANQYDMVRGYPGREYDLGVDWSGLRASIGIGFSFAVVNK